MEASRLGWRTDKRAREWMPDPLALATLGGACAVLLTTDQRVRRDGDRVSRPPQANAWPTSSEPTNGTRIPAAFPDSEG